jgi:hypothetical protein
MAPPRQDDGRSGGRAFGHALDSAASIVLGLRRGPDGWPARLAAVAVGLGLLGNAAYLHLVGGGDREDGFILAEAAAVILLTGHCLRLAWRRRGWERLAPLVLGYALQALHLGIWVAAVGHLLHGAYLYLAALAVLLTLGLHATLGGGAESRPGSAGACGPPARVRRGGGGEGVE